MFLLRKEPGTQEFPREETGGIGAPSKGDEGTVGGGEFWECGEDQEEMLKARSVPGSEAPRTGEGGNWGE